MSVFNAADLLTNLEAELSEIKYAAEQLKSMSPDVLRKQPQPGKWSVLQVLEHLNSYNRYYLPAIEKTITQAEKDKSKANRSYTSGWLGDYFVKTMYSQINQNSQIANKMNAPKEHRPSPELNYNKVITEFLNGVGQLNDLLQRAKKVDLEKAKTPISIAKFLKIRLGDTFRFLIAHKTRHFLQIKNTLLALQSA